MTRLLRTLFLYTLVASASCTSRIYYGPDAGNWQHFSLPDTTDIAYTVYLLGDAGAPKLDKTEPTLKLLKSQLDRDPKSTLLVLGDNLYHDGLSEVGGLTRERDEKRLDEQIKVVADHQGKVFFVPGNHDWDYMGPKGLEKIRRQEQYIEAGINKGNTFVPDNGCPGPYVEQVSEDVIFIGIDSHWWLHKHEKPYGPESGCGAGNETQMLQQIEATLEANKGKHIVIGAHHPFVSNSNHGGFYTVMDHLFPLRLIRDGLMIPLPVIGSLYPFYRQLGGVDQDIPHYRYQLLISRMEQLFNRYDNIIYASGHDHNLQLHKVDKYIHIISGSGCKVTPADTGNNATFVHSEKGFVKVIYYTNGEVWTEFWSPEGDGDTGQVNYRGKLYDQIRPDATGTAACTDSLMLDPVEFRPADPRKRPYALAGILLKDDYAKEWATPVRVSYLDLSAVDGGLSPFGLTKDRDRNSLRLRSANGYEYRFRPLLRDALRTVPQQYRGSSAIQSVPETWLPSQHPYAPLIVTPLEKAAGLLASSPTLHLLPDIDCLEPYKAPFGNRLGFLEFDAEDYRLGHTSQDADDVQELSYAGMLHNIEDNHLHQVNARAFAKARLLDMLIGDWDRHEDNYEWSLTETNGRTLYLPIPKVRDNAFFAFNGFFPWLATRSWGVQELQHFGYKIENLKGLNMAAKDLDRRLLGSLTPTDWRQIADSLEAVLTDDVLAEAVRQMPPEVYPMHGDELAQKLKARRAQLPRVAEEYGQILSRYVDVYGSKKKELFQIERLASGDTRITMAAADNPSLTLYTRTFNPEHTKEIRLYGFGGDDEFRVTGQTGSDIKVRVIGYKEYGRYQFAYSDSLGNNGNTYTLLNSIGDKKVFDNTRATYEDFATGDLINSPASDEFRYTRFGPNFTVVYNSADGLVLGAGLQYQPYKFRTSAKGGRQRLLYQRSLKTGMARIFHEGEIKNLFFNLDFVSRAWVYAPHYSMQYRGYGNRPALTDVPIDERVEMNNAHISAALQKPFGTFFSFGAGPVFEFFRLSERRNSWVQELLPENRQDVFGQRNYLGATAFFRTDVKDNEHNPSRGLVVDLRGNWFQGMANTSGRYSRYNYEVRYYMSPSLPFQLTFAGRMGGGINTGRYAFYQGNMIGGGLLPDFSQTIRGFSQNRLIGDRSFFTNLELRASVLDYRVYLFPGKIGVLGLYDTGRVWTRTNNVGGWNQAYGGGIWFSLFNRIVLTGTAAHSREGTLINIQNGFFF
jgi:hypothetical protein